MATVLPLAALVLALPQDPVPPARALSLELTSTPRLAGTTGSLVGARICARHLEAAGWEVELDERLVLLSLPRRLELAVFEPGSNAALLRRVDRFDPDAIPPGDVPRFNAWSASGEVRAEVVAVGHGLRADYERLAADGIDPHGKIALCKYGRSYRGVKVELAEEHGCAGVLLYSDPAGDGDEKGEVWPRGPWKPAWEAQRGSISPMASAPGDPSTPGWASPPPGGSSRRLLGRELADALPRIPCLPIGAREARAMLERSGPVEVYLSIDQPRELRTIVNVIATLAGESETLVLAGSHRDAWVRGANDSGSGTVALIRAAQHLGERARSGWRPRSSIVIGLWDAEEFGLIGSTEWAEANEERLRRDARAYVNADAAVSGTRFGASGAPGMLGILRAALEQLALDDSGDTVWEQWAAGSEDGPRLGLPGSGSDFAVFLHHLSVPILDVGFRGNSGGQYHTAFDDFPVVDRYLDPGWRGHELAGLALAEILATLAQVPNAGFDSAEAAREMARRVRGEDEWLGEERAVRLARSLRDLAAAVEARRANRATMDSGDGDPAFYRRLEGTGLPGRPWYRNRLWAPGLETGYSSEFLPTLRAAAAVGEEALERELEDLVRAIEGLRADWAGDGEGLGWR